MPNGGLGWVVFSKVSYTWWFGALCLGSDTGSTGASPMLLLLCLTWYMGIMAVMTFCVGRSIRTKGLSQPLHAVVFVFSDGRVFAFTCH